MIFVDRTSVPIPAILDSATSKGKAETAKAITHYTTANQTKAFQFKVYSNPEVKQALIDLFKGKCAYCESNVLHIYPGDVEHFRPKGEIAEATPNKKPGYYWLAAEWDNLLLSCRNCNQKLKHRGFGETSKKTMGKMNQFPLSDPTKYVRNHTNPTGIKDEEQYRLLLNPCIEDPEIHLKYGDEGTIKPKEDAVGIISPLGSKSIDVYVLQRTPLVQSRELLKNEIEAQIQTVKEALLNYNEHLGDADNAKLLRFEDALQRELKRLKKFLSPEAQYLGMARQLLREFLCINFGIII